MAGKLIIGQGTIRFLSGLVIPAQVKIAGGMLEEVIKAPICMCMILNRRANIVIHDHPMQM